MTQRWPYEEDLRDLWIAMALCEFFRRPRESPPLKVLELDLGKSVQRIPTATEVREYLRAYLQRERILARIETAQLFGTYPYVVELHKELAQVTAEIDKRST